MAFGLGCGMQLVNLDTKEMKNTYSTNMATNMANVDEYEEVKTTLEEITAENEAMKKYIAGKINEIQIMRTMKAYRNKGVSYFH